MVLANTRSAVRCPRPPLGTLYLLGRDAISVAHQLRGDHGVVHPEQRVPGVEKDGADGALSGRHAQRSTVTTSIAGRLAVDSASGTLARCTRSDSSPAGFISPARSSSSAPRP